jgi:hypothetical protein
MFRVESTLLRFIFGPQDCITPESFLQMEQLPCASKSSELLPHVCFSTDHKGCNSNNCLKVVSIVPEGQPQVVRIFQLIFPFVLCKRSPQKKECKFCNSKLTSPNIPNLFSLIMMSSGKSLKISKYAICKDLICNCCSQSFIS